MKEYDPWMVDDATFKGYVKAKLDYLSVTAESNRTTIVSLNIKLYIIALIVLFHLAEGQFWKVIVRGLFS